MERNGDKMYEKFVKWLTPGINLMFGIVLLLIGIIWQVLSNKPLYMYAFYIMAAAMICFNRGIVLKISKATIDPASFIILNMLIVILGVVFTESDWADGMVMYAVWGICLLIDWVVNAILLRCDGVAKRIVMGFVSVLINMLLIGMAFFVPVLIEAFGGRK